MINGLLCYLVLVLILMSLHQFIPFAVGVPIVVAYFCWAIVGIVRCALRTLRSPASTNLAKAFSAAAIALVLVATFYTVKDLSLLLG